MSAAARAPRSRGLRAAVVARVVLALLVSASVAAFFYAQALKREAPLVLDRTAGITTFQPGGRGVQDAHFHMTVSVGDVLDVGVRSARTGAAIAVIAHGLPVREYRRFELHWNGRTATGALAPPGGYLLTVHFRQAAQTVIVPNFRLELKGASG